MRIEVLYVPGCPNHHSTVERVKQILQSEAVEASVCEITVADEVTARSLHFPGSPTVRINGVDAEPSESQSFGLACRLYCSGSGTPSPETLRRAISTAKEQEDHV